MNTQTTEYEVDELGSADDDGPGLEFVSESDPDESIAQLANEPSKPRLVNGIHVKGEKRVTPRDPSLILEGIQNQTGGWPKCVAGELVIKSFQNKLEIKKNEAELFAWLHQPFGIDWLGSPAISKREFFEYCRDNADKFSDATHYPHFPPFEDVLYEHEEPVHEYGQALAGFLDFFSPATPHDRELIKAFALSLFWGGPPGARPGFLITTNDNTSNQGRGWGKTTLLELCSELCGGTISASKSESIEALKKRILSQANHEPRPRVIAIDNVKTRRFSSADLEALITSRQISGHIMYRGNGAVPNHHTVGITINGASLSKDLAQRCVVIKVAKPSHTQSWQKDIEEFIKNKRWSIIGDIGELLASNGFDLPNEGSTRWAYWESAVLSKVNNPVQVRELIKSRQGQLDDDDANGVEFVKHLQENFHRFKVGASPIAKIPHKAMHELLEEFLGEKLGKNVVTKKISALGLPCLHQVAKPGKLRVWLFRKDGQELTPTQIESESTAVPE